MSHNFSKSFGRYLKAVSVKTPKTVFHSFRHNFKDAMQAVGIDSTIQHTLMGHTDKSMDGTYGSTGIPVPILAQAIDKLTLPVDLKHLYIKG